MRHVTFVANDAIFDFKLGRRRAYIDNLVGHLHELREIERPVVECAGQTKSVIHQHGLARPISFVHPTDLRDGGVRFIDNHEKVFREEIDDRVGL